MEAGFEVDEIYLGHHGGVERGGTRAGGALPESVPVILDHDLGLVRVHHGDDPAPGVGALGIGVDPVGEDAAGGIVLGAADDKAAVGNGADLGVHLPHFHGADFRPGVAHQFPGDEARKPSVAFGSLGRDQPVLDEGKVGTQPLGEVRVGRGQVGQQGKELGKRGSRTPV
ncbi:hypothetical protein GCM10025778_10060 [Paeniglutamicibacter antarcticus]|uniref:Uncharacterized protein n=1 Tax=Paeniglutamicibacter antarcticus TaxID=494023 RepID=A0ABP9TJX6_9MICC